MNLLVKSFLEAIQESIHRPYEGNDLSKNEKLSVLDDLIGELKAEMSYIESVE